LDFIPEDSAAFAKAVQSIGLLTLSKKMSGFLIQGARTMQLALRVIF